MCRNVYPCQQIKNCVSSLYQTLSTTVFATTLFVTKIMCCCVTHDATSSILRNSTNEANTFLTMYNVIRFSRLSKLVSSNLKLYTFYHAIGISLDVHGLCQFARSNVGSMDQLYVNTRNNICFMQGVLLLALC